MNLYEREKLEFEKFLTLSTFSYCQLKIEQTFELVLVIPLMRCRGFEKLKQRRLLMIGKRINPLPRISIPISWKNEAALHKILAIANFKKKVFLEKRKSHEKSRT